MSDYKPIYYLLEDCNNIKIECTAGVYKYIEKNNMLSREMASRNTIKRKNFLYLGKVVRKSTNIFDMIDKLDLIEYNYNNNIKIVCIEDLRVLEKLDVKMLKGIFKRQPNKDYKYFEAEKVVF